MHRTIIDELEKLRGEKATFRYTIIHRELEELNGRAWIASLRDDLVDEVSHLGEYHRLDQAFRRTNTHVPSLNSKEIAQALVTDALRDAFAAELEAFEIAGPHVARSRLKRS